MSSDIDIKEHDVFEHPTIKKNFPDISRIKTEVIEIDSEEASECRSNCEPGYPTTSDPDRGHFDNDDILRTDNLLSPVISQNKIIIGSKPKKQEKDPFSVKVILKDWSYILENHPFYCKQCLILFPTQNTLDAHGMTVHSLLVVKDEIDVELGDDNFMNSMQDDSNEVLVKCPICSYHFKALRQFYLHCEKQHNTIDLKPIYDNFKRDCLFCSSKCSTLASHCKHISVAQSDIYKKEIIDDESSSANVASNTSGHFDTVSVNKAKKSTSKCVGVYKNQIAKKSTAKNTLIEKENHPNLAKKSTAKLDNTSKNVIIEGTSRNRTAEGVAICGQSKNKAVKSTAKSSLGVSAEVDKGGLVLYKCPVCGLYFKLVLRYVRHCQTSHRAAYLTPKRELFDGSCFCGYESHNYLVFAKHLSRTHVDLYRKIATDIQEFYCVECNFTFTTANSLHIHKIAKHNENSAPVETAHAETENESLKPKINSLKLAYPEQVKNSLKRKSAPEASTNSKMTKFNGNSSKETKTNKKAKDDEIDSTSDDDSCDTTDKIVIIPKEIIFKCPLCSLHFVSGTSAYFHLIQCKGRDPDLICSICNLGFKFWDEDSHRLQHHVYSVINAIDINKELFWRLVFVCVDCKVGFSSRLVSQHTDCNKSNSKMCLQCNLYIDEKSIPKHSTIHEKDLKPYVVEFKRGNLNDLKISKPNTEHTKNILYYCCICKSYDPTLQLAFHKEGDCKNSRIFRICRHCGLRFTQASYAAHAEQHSNKSSQLSEFKFIDVHTGKTIKPKIPNWNKCKGPCKVKYSGEEHSHECFQEKSVYCPTCKETFNELAYKIHVQYHEYEIPNDIDAEIMEKYLNMLSLWNIVFRCQDCDVIFDNYDLVIEHSQDHFSEGSCEVSKKTCSKCGLTFATTVFDRHKVLHSGADINKYSFHILNFNHKHLLNDSWFDIFEPISDEQKNYILAKSIYDLQRGLRLELNVDGPSIYTLYKCAVCETIVDAPSIVDHANNRDACVLKKQKLNCSVCQLSFSTIQSLSDHETLHESAEYRTRILIFNRPGHFKINEPIIKVFRKESLKFNWCQECSILIKKDEFQAHMSSHGKENEVAGVGPRSNLIYKCVICGAGLVSRRSLSSHRCLPKRFYTECKHCKLLFLPSFLKRHYHLHKNLTKYHIVPFRNGVVLKPGPTKALTLYQCTKCKVCRQDRYRLHSCVPLSKQTTCELCKYNFRSSMFHKHMQCHARISNITSDNINIIEYTPNAKSTMRHSSIVYKCDCNLLFIKQEKLLKHLSICSEDALACKCTTCGLTFHESSLQDHLKVHVDCSAAMTYMVVDIKIGKGATRDPKRWLWVCATCNMHSVYLKGLNCHIRQANQKMPNNKKLCQICKVYFSADTLGAHVKWHHKTYPSNVADLHKKCVRNVSAKDLNFEYLNREIVDDTVISNFEDKAEPNKVDGNVSGKDRPVLYKCVACDQYFIKDRHLELHYYYSYRNSSLVKCNFCNFDFTTRIIDTHLKLHHSEPNYKAEDFIIKTHTKSTRIDFQSKIWHVVKPRRILVRKPVIETDTETNVQNTKTDTMAKSGKTISVQKIPLKNTNILKIDMKKKSFLSKSIAKTPLELLKTIHQCSRCKLNTVVSSTMNSHFKRNEAGTCNDTGHKRHLCPQCGLDFTVKSLARHYFVHHTKLKLKMEDFNIRIYSGKDEYTTIHANKDLEKAESAERPNEPQPVMVKKINTLVMKAGNDKHKPVEGNVIPKPVLVRRGSNGRYAKANNPSGADARASTANVPNHTVVSRKTVEFNENAPKLFKCGECDVYFATYEMCYDHSIQHKPLDPTEFIACKVCDLQIICECLGVHMRGHREGTFYIDDLVVTEFQPTDGVPFTETYLAAKLLHSNSISTTTNCGE